MLNTVLRRRSAHNATAQKTAPPPEKEEAAISQVQDISNASLGVDIGDIALHRLLDLQADASEHSFLKGMPKTYSKHLLSALHCSLFYSRELARFTADNDCDPQNRKANLSMSEAGLGIANQKLEECMHMVLDTKRYSNSFGVLCKFLNQSIELRELCMAPRPDFTEINEKRERLERLAMKF